MHQRTEHLDRPRVPRPSERGDGEAPHLGVRIPGRREQRLDRAGIPDAHEQSNCPPADRRLLVARGPDQGLGRGATHVLEHAGGQLGRALASDPAVLGVHRDLVVEHHDQIGSGRSGPAVEAPEPDQGLGPHGAIRGEEPLDLGTDLRRDGLGNPLPGELSHLARGDGGGEQHRHQPDSDAAQSVSTDHGISPVRARLDPAPRR
jgi:hypothetical protein